MAQKPASLNGRRVLITGAARGIGAGLARRLYSRGARVALLGLESERLAEVAADVGDAPWRYCDVRDADAVRTAVAELAEELGGLDVVVANAGIAQQLPMIGGRAGVLEQTLRVNVLGVHHTIDAAGPFIAHRDGYVLAVSSLAAAVQMPLLGAYSASKAAVEAIGNTARIELRPTGARVGVAYFAELDTDMTSRGFGTNAAKSLLRGRTVTKVTPLKAGVDALERAISTRSRRAVAPGWIAPLLPLRALVQRIVELGLPRGMNDALRIAREEQAEFTTAQPGGRE